MFPRNPRIVTISVFYCNIDRPLRRNRDRPIRQPWDKRSIPETRTASISCPSATRGPCILAPDEFLKNLSMRQIIHIHPPMILTFHEKFQFPHLRLVQPGFDPKKCLSSRNCRTAPPCPYPKYPVSPKSTWGAKIYLVSTHKVQNFPLKPTLLDQITVY